VSILVTGGAGYIGSVLVGHLLVNGYNVTVLDSLLYGGESLLAYHYHPGFHLVVGDVRTDWDIARALESRPIAIVHLAAIVGEKACKKLDWDTVVSVNLDATLKLVKRCKREGIPHFIFASTCSNYGVADGMLAEDAELKPLSIYAETKVMAESAVLNHNSNGFATTVLRFATAYGLSPRTRLDVLLNQFAYDAVTTGKLSVYNKSAWRPLAHVHDIAEAVRFSVEHRSLFAGEVVNVGGHNVTKEDLVYALKALLPDLEVTYTETDSDARDYRVNFGKLLAMGYRPHYLPADGLRETVKALRNGVIREPHCGKWRNA
jgi:nucleoside-diphosphate-sugar epimerase